VLDSCPGDHGLATTFAVLRPKGPVLSYVLAPLLYAIIAMRQRLEHRQPLFTEIRLALLQEELLSPFITASPVTERVYIYSTSDSVVKVEDVEAHVEAARTAGLHVDTEKFTTPSPHVGHARTDERRYWEAVARTWKKACHNARAKL
ncbi:hypothetical protein EXIGLDRAFT_627377, partial [Exidia glandulosa HHB12029]